MIDAATRAAVRRRAGDRCEYCLLRQEHDLSSLHVEHIAAKQHGGTDDPSNLALACIHCNLHKGPNPDISSGFGPVNCAMALLLVGFGVAHSTTLNEQGHRCDRL